MTYEECEVEITEQSTETKCQNYTTTKIEQECRNKTEETCRQDFEYICHEYKKPHYGYPKPKPKPIGNLNSLFFLVPDKKLITSEIKIFHIVVCEGSNQFHEIFVTRLQFGFLCCKCLH